MKKHMCTCKRLCTYKYTSLTCSLHCLTRPPTPDMHLQNVLHIFQLDPHEANLSTTYCILLHLRDKYHFDPTLQCFLQSFDISSLPVVFSAAQREQILHHYLFPQWAGWVGRGSNAKLTALRIQMDASTRISTSQQRMRWSWEGLQPRVTAVCISTIVGVRWWPWRVYMHKYYLCIHMHTCNVCIYCLCVYVYVHESIYLCMDVIVFSNVCC